MDEMLREFVGESIDLLDEAAIDLVTWEQDPADGAALDRMFRAIHTIKGSSSFFELARITALAHATEAMLDALRARRGAPDPEDVAIVLDAVARLDQLVRDLGEQGCEPPGEDKDLLALLEDQMRGAGAPRHRPAAPQPEAPSAPDVDTATEAPPPAADTASRSASWRSVRVPLDLLDRLMNSVSDLILTRNCIFAQLHADDRQHAASPEVERFNAQLFAVRAMVAGMRMMPLRQIFTPLTRLVRQVAGELGKQVHFAGLGGDVEIDREVGEALRDPLVHLLRNAIDHGIEPPHERAAAGKPPAATIRVHARRANNRIVITIADDGRGVDVERVVQRAVERRVVTAAAAALMDADAQAALIFQPGLSTAAHTTTISGRGVGMDLVRANIERIGGSVTLANAPGAGLTVTIDVPMSLAIVSALVMPVGGQDMAIPRSQVVEALHADDDMVELVSAGGSSFARIRGTLVPLIDVDSALGLASVDPLDSADRVLVVVRLRHGRNVALAAPDVRDHEELVVRPLPPVLAATGQFSGMCLPDNGRPMLVVDIDGLAARHLSSDIDLAEPAPDTAAEVATPAAASADIWLTMQAAGHEGDVAVPMAAIERLIDVPRTAIRAASDRLFVEVDGALLPLLGDGAHGVGAHAADASSTGAGPGAEGPVRIVCLTAGGRRLGLIATQVIGTEPIDPATIMDGDPGAVVTPLIGLALVGNRLIELLDVHALLARYGIAATRHGVVDTAAAEPLWLVERDFSPGTLHLLTRALTAAGHAVRIITDADQADGDAPLLIARAPDGAEASLAVGRAGQPPREVSLWDRAGIDAALLAERAA